MIENQIRGLLDAPPSGEGAPTLESIEDSLTAGYARAMALEADQWRLQRRIALTAVELAHDGGELRTAELKELARELEAVDADLLHLRALLGSLRARATDARAAAAAA
jgi:hypothetical protein